MRAEWILGAAVLVPIFGAALVALLDLFGCRRARVFVYLLIAPAGFAAAARGVGAPGWLSIVAAFIAFAMVVATAHERANEWRREHGSN